MIDHEIRVSLQEDGCSECSCELKGQYCAIVMAYDHNMDFGKGNSWYNTGIVEWAKTPEEAFNAALEKHKSRTALRALIELEDRLSKLTEDELATMLLQIPTTEEEAAKYAALERFIFKSRQTESLSNKGVKND